MEFLFLTLEDVLYIQSQEAALTNSPTIIRSRDGLESAIAAPQASFEGSYLMDIFEMASTYVVSIAINHPFIDGNKRAAAASALVFLKMNGFDLNESSDEELADKLLSFLSKEISKEDLTEYFKKNSAPT